MFISKIKTQAAGPRALFAGPRLLITGLALFAVLFAADARATTPPDSFADLAERLLPSVVNISTTQTIKNPQAGLEMPQFPPGSPLEEFFKAIPQFRLKDGFELGYFVGNITFVPKLELQWD